ncbi:50S ribosomal protein L11 [Candidatus Woesearchaeota archaeon]|nr:MAG: 50S ribosomal protein L11 [Candidatus Woesearchaeota archaeon]
MAMQSVKALVNGGQASAAPPLGPALGPLGINIGQVVSEINKKTASFKGMQVPVEVKVDSETKEFSISIGTPPTSQLILKEAGIEKGSGKPHVEKVADLKIEQVIKISKMKEDAVLGKDLKHKMKEVIGSCDSMGVLVEGVDAREAMALVDQGKFDKEIKEEKTEISAQEQKELEEERKRLQADLEKRHAELDKTAQAVMKEMTGKEASAIRAKLREAGIPDDMIAKLVPQEKKDDKKEAKK